MQNVFGIRPNTKAAVLVFGLFHGLGLATKMEELSPGRSGLVANILSFNLGVELGQILALSAVIIALVSLRSRRSFLEHSFLTNVALMAAGFALAGTQVIRAFLW